MSIPGIEVSGYGWIRDTDFSNADMRDAVFFTREIVDTTFANADLSGLQSNMSGMDWRTVDLSGANLRGAFLAEANEFIDSDLTGVDFTNAELRTVFFMDASLVSAVLAGADLSHGSLLGSDLTDADLTDVTWNNTTCPDGSNSDDDDGDGFTCESNRTP